MFFGTSRTPLLSSRSVDQFARYFDVSNVHPIFGREFSLPQVSYDPSEYNPWGQGQPDHIIVLTHGWQQSAVIPGFLRFDPDKSNLPGIESAIRDRLSDQITEGSVVLFDEPWREAFTLLTSYDTALEATEEVGRRRGEQILELVEQARSNGREPTIHLIGHSLGTLVNANTVARLNEADVTVDRVTILDSPLNASRQFVRERFGEEAVNTRKGELLESDDALIFWSLMPHGSVGVVENFFADEESVGPFSLGVLNPFDEFSVLAPRFGQPIGGASPCLASLQSCSGQEVDGVDHSSIADEFYPDLVSGTLSQRWATPALGTNNFDEISWDPSGLIERRLAEVNSRVSDLQESGLLQRALLFFGDVFESNPFVSNVQERFGRTIFEGRVAELIAESPVGFSAEVDLDSVLSLAFELDTSEAAPGILSVFVDGEERWSVQIEDLNGANDLFSVPLLSDFGTREVLFLYDTDTTGATLRIKDLAAIALVAIPEPASFLIAITALCSLCRSRPSRL